MDAVAVLKDDMLLGLRRFSDNVVHNVFSVSKSRTATAIGFAIGEGSGYGCHFRLNHEVGGSYRCYVRHHPPRKECRNRNSGNALKRPTHP